MSVVEAIYQLLTTWQDSGLPGFMVLAAAFVVGAMALVPRAPLCVAGGLLFGFSAFPVALIASTAGAIFALLVSRYVLRSYFRRLIEGRPHWRAILQAVDNEGWRVLILLRLASPVPGTITSYAFGLTRMTIWHYGVATFIGSIPQVFLFVYMGAAGRATLHSTPTIATYFVWMTGLMATGAAVMLLARRSKKALRALSN